MTAVQIDIDGHDQPDRVCACGCNRALDGMRRDAVWYSRACAVRWGRSNPGRSLNEAHRANKARTQTRRRRSGLQVSFPKAFAQLEDFLTEHGHLTPYTTARAILKGALSERQRAKLAGSELRVAPTLTTDQQREALR